MRATTAFLVLLLLAGGGHGADEDDPARLWDFGDPAGSEARFRERIEALEAEGAEDAALVFRTQLARALGLQGRFEEGHAELDRVAARLDGLPAEVRVRLLLERGRLHRSGGDTKASLPLFREALEVAESSGAQQLALDAVHMVALAAPPEAQLAWHEKAWALVSAAEDPRARAWFGAVANNLAWAYFDRGRHEEALDIHRRAWAWREEKGGGAPARIARWSVARVLRALGRGDEALAHQRALVEAWRRAGEENGFVAEEMGELLLEAGREDEALPWFARAWALLEDVAWLREEEPERAARLARLADGATLVRVPPGPYLRRPYEGWKARETPFPVHVDGFFVDRTEVTNAHFARFLATRTEIEGLLDPSVPGFVHRPDRLSAWEAEAGREDLPVTAATGAGALAYAAWAGGRLPTREEWEKAASGPEGWLYPWGDEAPDATRANFGRPEARGLMPVASYAAGASWYGVMDMAGNAYERVLTPETNAPTTLKGGSWLTPHPLNLRVLDQCMQPPDVAEGSVGFRLVVTDPEPDRPPPPLLIRPRLRVATSLDEAVEEARRRRVPLLLSLHYDTCGQCDRVRRQVFTDPRFVAYANDHLVVVIGHQPGHAFRDAHPPLEGGRCPFYPDLACEDHEIAFRRGLAVVGSFGVSPGTFLLDPDRVETGAGKDAVLAGEAAFPKWGGDVEAWLAACEAARNALAARGDARR